MKTGEVDPDSMDNFGRTPLSYAAEAGYHTVTRLLLHTGRVDLDSKDRDGITPQGWAVEGSRWVTQREECYTVLKQLHLAALPFGSS